MDISSFPCTQLVFAFSLGWTLKEVNINGDFNQYIWAFSLGWTQETDVRVTSSSLLISSGKPEEVFPTNIFSVLNECPPIIYWAKIIQYNPHSISTKPFLSPLIFYWAVVGKNGPMRHQSFRQMRLLDSIFSNGCEIRKSLIDLFLHSFQDFFLLGGTYIVQMLNQVSKGFKRFVEPCRING